MTKESPSAAVTRDDFARNLARSGLSNADEVAAALAALPADEAPDGPAAAKRLVAAGALTPYQADAVLADRPGDLRMGNYELTDKLGQGGMGAVFKARHRRMKRVVALKVLAREVARSDTFAQRFQREVETIAQLTHPNIVMAFDADEADGGLFLVMEFVDGRDLMAEVQKGGPLSVADAVECLVQSARGLECAHGKNIVHRDVKPSNLLRDASGVVKVADLGLARLSGGEAQNTSLTAAGGMVGTLDFMAPEQALDSTAVDHRADVYSLGATLFYLLAGQAPFAATSMLALLLKHREAPVPSVRDHRPDAPPELDALIQRMMAKAPAARPQTMAEVVQALEAVRAAGPLPATRTQSLLPTSQAKPGSSEITMDLGGAGQQSSQVLNRADTVTSRGGTGATPDGPLAGTAVVLVEASRTQAGIIRTYLRQLGAADVQVTGTGRDVPDLIRQTGAAVVVSAMHLSDMSGVQLAHALAADPATAAVGFVLATSESDSCGALTPRTVLMPKPFTPERLVRAVTAALAAAAR